MREEVFQKFENILEKKSRKNLYLNIYYNYESLKEVIKFYGAQNLVSNEESILIESGNKVVYIDFKLFHPFVGYFSTSIKNKIPKFFESISFSNEDFLRIDSVNSFLLEYENEDVARKASIASTSTNDVKELLKILKSKCSIKSCTCGESGRYKIDRNGKINFIEGNFIGMLYEIKDFISDKYSSKEITINFSSAQKDIHKINQSIADFIGYGTFKIVGNRAISIITDGFNLVYIDMDMIKLNLRLIKGENLSLLKKIASFIQEHYDPEAIII